MISMSVLAETEEAVVAPARSARRWSTARLVLLVPRVRDRAGDDDGSALQRAARDDLRGRSSSSTSRLTSCSRRASISLRVAGRLRCSWRLAATLGPTSSTCCRSSSVASAILLELREAVAAELGRGALGGHRDREADQRLAQPHALAALDRVDHVLGRDLADAVELEQRLPCRARRSRRRGRACRPRSRCRLIFWPIASMSAAALERPSG